MRFLTLLSILLLTFSCSEKPNMKENFSEAIKLTENKQGIDWQKVKQLLEPSIPYASDVPNILALAAIADSNTANFSSARELIQKAIVADPENLDYVFFAGRIEQLDGNYTAAIDYFRTVLGKKKDEEALIWLIRSQYLKSENLKEFIQNSPEMEMAIQGRPTAEAYNLAMLKAVILKEPQHHIFRNFARAQSAGKMPPAILLNFAIINDIYFKRKQSALTYYRNYLKKVNANTGDQELLKQVKDRIAAIEQGQ